MDFLKGLNPQQQAGVSHIEGPLLLLAGAGSGKTCGFTHRIAHFVEAHHAPGPCILAVTVFFQRRRAIPYACGTPGFAGLFQVNLLLPANCPPNPEIQIGFSSASGDNLSPAQRFLPVQ
jgi:uncharacterized protein (TIGR03437 family)